MAKEKAAERQAALDYAWLSQVRASLADCAARLDLMSLAHLSESLEDPTAGRLGKALAFVRAAITEIDRAG